ncbi:MAG: TSUP family transporter [Deltaproteobacteria bacterium]|nr:TSUP family transporter [Deltaproteobacteria bacterium]
MPYFIVALAALLTAGLTLFSGFGLGTLFLPVFALFFPLRVAIALTAVVHLANNLLKFALLGKYANRAVVLRFGLPAIAAAYLGAQALLWLGELDPLFSYHLWGRTFHIMPVKLVIAILMISFALLETAQAARRFSLPPRYLPLGGLLSGFFGGLSGHQGALRSIFLLRYGLAKEGFIGTGVIIACLVDFSRLIVYFDRFFLADFTQNAGILLTAIAAAFAGTFLGSRLLGKITMRGIQLIVALLLSGIALGLAAGFI